MKQGQKYENTKQEHEQKQALIDQGVSGRTVDSRPAGRPRGRTLAVSQGIGQGRGADGS